MTSCSISESPTHRSPLVYSSARSGHHFAVSTFDWRQKHHIWEETLSDGAWEVQYAAKSLPQVGLQVLDNQWGQSIALGFKGVWLDRSAFGSFLHVFAYLGFPSWVSPNRPNQWGSWTNTTWWPANRPLLRSFWALGDESGPDMSRRLPSWVLFDSASRVWILQAKLLLLGAAWQLSSSIHHAASWTGRCWLCCFPRSYCHRPLSSRNRCSRHRSLRWRHLRCGGQHTRSWAFPSSRCASCGDTSASIESCSIASGTSDLIASHTRIFTASATVWVVWG